MLNQSQGPSPSAKRVKTASESVKHIKTDPLSTSTPPSQQQEHLVQFKMEKMDAYESGGEHSSIVENVDNMHNESTFEENLEETHADETEDYSIMEGEEEPQAGTSTDGLGDGQGM